MSLQQTSSYRPLWQAIDHSLFAGRTIQTAATGRGNRFLCAAEESL